MTRRHLRCTAFWSVILAAVGGLSARADEPLLTVAERSNFKATSTHKEVMEYCEQLAKLSPLVRQKELGASHEGRALPLLILADPPVSTPDEAERSGKLVVFAFANIHSGECDGKEGVLMLARDIVTGPLRGLLKDLIVVLAPNFNADGNDRMARSNRPGQVGPEAGMGTRENAQGFDLNRDFVKLESPEVRALVRFLTKWDPAVIVDCHTTNGSKHRYTITYEGPRSPAGDSRLVDMVRDGMLPDVTKRLEKIGGYKSFFYGNFSRDRTRWETVPATARYGIHYMGLRNRISILSESYSYATYKDRVLASRAFVRSIFEHTAANKDRIRTLLAEVRDTTVKAGLALKADDRVALRHKAIPLASRSTVLGYKVITKEGRNVASDQPDDLKLDYLGRTEPTLSVRRPYAYVLSASQAKVVENLQRHGIDVEELREDIELDLEVYQTLKIERARYPFQKHQLENVEVAARQQSRRIPAGTIVVRTSQPLGTLAVYLLEPQSEDGLCTWNFFDSLLAEGQDFPVARLLKSTPMLLAKVRSLAENRTMNKPVTFDTPFADLNGTPESIGDWLEDGVHYLHESDGVTCMVEARTGRSKALYDAEKVAAGLAKLPMMTKVNAETLSRRAAKTMNPQRTAAYLEHENDLYVVNLDGSNAQRLTRNAAREELTSWSPNGQLMAFVRENNLYVVDKAKTTEVQLTTDGSPVIFNGKADWVYWEEIFNRTHHAYHWSPDSSQIAFFRYDDTPVPKFTVLDHLPLHLTVEQTPYPKSGDPNPTVKLGIVSVSGGPIRWVDFSQYSENAMLVVRAGWTPDSKQIYCYVQDRAQTWLDFCMVSPEGGKPTRLFRETTKAWVEDLGAAHFLKDGSFLVQSERTGWKHLYHYDKTGKVIRPVTTGEWECRDVQRVDEKAGWAYFSGTKDDLANQASYRAKLDGSLVEKVVRGSGSQRTSISPKNDLVIVRASGPQGQAQTHLYTTGGELVRTLDTNPVYSLEEYTLSTTERMQIQTPDGFLLEASVSLPAKLDKKKKYPVWFMTYGGPHAPTVSGTRGTGRGQDDALTNMGFIVFHADPRSASGKGAVSTWTAYRQLGVQELKDIETAIQWLIKEHPYVDAERIGMSGSSYGGFLTAFCMTHSKIFAAGIAEAAVTDWHLYDSIYTERYMNTPQENPEGYEKTSVVKAAGNLHGKLLLIHGVMDDNVHVQNSVQLMQELQRSNKLFEMMFYPKARHGGFGRHSQQMKNDFMVRTLKPVKD